MHKWTISTYYQTYLKRLSLTGIQIELTAKARHGITTRVNSRTFVPCLINIQILVEIPEEKQYYLIGLSALVNLASYFSVAVEQ